MKLTNYFLIPALCLFFHAVYAKLDISLPDADSHWTVGSEETVVWSSSATEFGLLCKIQMIDIKTDKVVWNITETSTPCSINTLKTQPLPSFEHDKFMIRIFDAANSTKSAYTENFKIYSNKTH